MQGDVPDGRRQPGKEVSTRNEEHGLEGCREAGSAQRRSPQGRSMELSNWEPRVGAGGKGVGRARVGREGMESELGAPVSLKDSFLPPTTRLWPQPSFLLPRSSFKWQGLLQFSRWALQPKPKKWGWESLSCYFQPELWGHERMGQCFPQVEGEGSQEPSF